MSCFLEAGTGGGIDIYLVYCYRVLQGLPGPMFLGLRWVMKLLNVRTTQHRLERHDISLPLSQVLHASGIGNEAYNYLTAETELINIQKNFTHLTAFMHVENKLARLKIRQKSYRTGRPTRRADRKKTAILSNLSPMPPKQSSKQNRGGGGG